MGSFVLWCRRAARRPTALCQLLGGTCSLCTDVHSYSWPCSVSSLCEESTVPCSTWLCCVFFGGSNTKIQWAEVFGFLLLMMSNRCHLLNRPYDGRVFQEVFNITDMRMCACMFKKEMGSRITEGVEKLDKCWFEVSVKLQMVQGNVGWKAGSPYLSLAKTTQSIQNRWLPISLKLSPWGHLGHPRLFGNCVAPLSKKD